MFKRLQFLTLQFYLPTKYEIKIHKLIIYEGQAHLFTHSSYIAYQIVPAWLNIPNIV